MTDAEKIKSLETQIKMLEASLYAQRFLNKDFHKIHDKWERALRRYAGGEKCPYFAREALGVCEYWDAGFGKRWMRSRRAWRRLKEWWRGPCCTKDS